MNTIQADTTIEAVRKQFEIPQRIWPVIKNMREIIMWPSRDERRLLRYYHKNRDQVGKESNYSLGDLVIVLYCRNSKEVSDHIKRESQRKTLENLNEKIKQHFFCKFSFLLNQQIRFRSPFPRSSPNIFCRQPSPR